MMTVVAGGTMLSIQFIDLTGEEISFSPPPRLPEASTEQVHQFCGACHAYPPAEALPRSVWRKEVKQGYDLFAKSPRQHLDYPPLESVVSYYERRAPESLPLLSLPPAGALPFRLQRQAYSGPDGQKPCGISHVQILRLGQRSEPAILVCDAMRQQILLFHPHRRETPWQVLASGFCCARAEVVDLDRDGIDDIVLAVLGSFYATDYRVGSVVWLKGKSDGSFEPVTLLNGIGRVADVRAADFNGDGRVDLMVAVFGWRQSGEIVLLENQTSDWSRPRFVPRVVDERHGTIHVPVVDLNHDGKPDFVALISQEHETIVAFLNDGSGRFHAETIYTAPHPIFGSSGIELVDLDGDGDLDVLYTNGDSLDAPYVLKPYHGVQWLENRGTFPFVPHRLADLYGAGSATAVDLDGDGRLDVAVACFLAADVYPQREELKLPAVTLFLQSAQTQFTRYTLETVSCDHLTCTAGDLDGTGRPSLVLGNFNRGTDRRDAVTILRPLFGHSGKVNEKQAPPSGTLSPMIVPP